VTDDGDDFPGRLFTFWPPRLLERLLVGAGFAVDHVTAVPPRGDGPIHNVVARATRVRTLPDTVGPGMRLLVCGLNPSLYSADVGVGYARPGNRFWPAALAAGIVSVDRHARHALVHHGVGLTDVVKRASVGAAELTPAEYRAGMARVRWLVGWLRPGAVCFVGLAGWRAAVDRRATAGVQPDAIDGVPAYVMPSTSGLNARSSVASLTDHLRRAADLADHGA
jgi:TDG/mug DNA glycosylase family protein